MTLHDQGNGHSIWFHYRFTSPHDRVREFHVELDPDTLGLVVKEREDYPEWTRLTHHQCANCPLRPEDHPRCPAAANLVDVIEHFRDAVSCEETEVEIATESRTYRKRVPLQDGLSALVVMAIHRAVRHRRKVLETREESVRLHTRVEELEAEREALRQQV